MLEVYVLVEKKKTLMMKLLTLLCFVIGAYFMYATLVGLIIFFAIAIPFLALGWFLHTRSIEYEYSYFDGDFRFAKIISKQKRKELIGYEADNVIVIAPKGDRCFHQYENNAQVKERDLTSGSETGNVYGMVAKAEEGYHLTWFEPDEKYLEAVCIKYRQKVNR